MNIAGIFLLIAPWLGVVIAFIYGLMTRSTARAHRGVLTMRNIGIVWILRLAVLAVLLTIGAQLLYDFGGCSGGVAGPLLCTDASATLVEAGLIIAIGNVVFALPLLGVSAIFLGILFAASPPVVRPEKDDP